MRMIRCGYVLLIGILSLSGCNEAPQPIDTVGERISAHEFDVLIRGGTVYDGTGSAGKQLDVALVGDTIAALGMNLTGTARQTVDADGMAIAPGFINMLSWAVDSLIEDGRAQSDIRQGVTLEVFGEGSSMGPLNEEMRERALQTQGDIKYPIAWTSLNDYLEYLEQKGVAPNIASFVGATTIRVHELGYIDRAPDEANCIECRSWFERLCAMEHWASVPH